MREPNIQNIVLHTEEAARLREALEDDWDRVIIIGADYGAIEEHFCTHYQEHDGHIYLRDGYVPEDSFIELHPIERTIKQKDWQDREYRRPKRRRSR